MPEPIPKSWRTAIIRALQTSDDRINDWTPIARQRWQTDTFGAWKCEAYDLMIAALSNDGVLGNATTTLQGQLAAYEFFFFRGNMRMYGKIVLRNDEKRILILSAHRAERETL